MNTERRTRGLRGLALAGGVALALMAAACGGDEAADTTTSASAGGGKPLTMAADPSLVPYNFFGDGGNKDWQGINVDIAAALSKQLDREIRIESVPFDSIIPGLKGGRYDFALTGMFDTKERQKTIDFVDYLRAKNNFLLRADDDSDVTSLADLCGRRVGLPKGALEIQLVEEQSAACRKDGGKAVDLKIFPDLNATAMGLAQDRVDVAPNDSAANAYLMSQREGEFRATGVYLDEGYFAAGVPKGSPLLKELQEGMQALVDSGEMKTILEKWGIADRMPKEITINQAAF